MKKLILMVASLVATLPLFAQASAGNVKSLSVVDFAEVIKKKDVVLLDVRSEKEYAEGHIDGATNVVWADKTFKPDFEKLKIKKKKTVAVYCRSGRRSMAAAKVLSEMGYQVVNLTGGIMAWQKESRTVVR